MAPFSERSSAAMRRPPRMPAQEAGEALPAAILLAVLMRRKRRQHLLAVLGSCIRLLGVAGHARPARRVPCIDDRVEPTTRGPCHLFGEQRWQQGGACFHCQNSVKKSCVLLMPNCLVKRQSHLRLKLATLNYVDRRVISVGSWPCTFKANAKRAQHIAYLLVACGTVRTFSSAKPTCREA